MWLLYASMFAIFSVGEIGMAFVVPGLNPATLLPFGAGLGLVAAVAFLTDPPSLARPANHVSIATIYVAVALGMVAFRPDSLIPLAPVMFLGPYAASRLTSRAQIAAHCVAASVVLAIPAALGLIGTSATFGVAILIPSIALLALCVVAVLEAAEAQGAELEQLVRRDPLTGAGNRRLLDEQLAKEIDRHHRSGGQLSVLALDLNGFKALNDTVGHAAGDDALQQVASALAAIAREQDTVVRQGGDEFCVLLTDTTYEQAMFVETAIRTSLAGLADGQLPITTGIGIATYPSDALRPSELLAAADARLAFDKERTDPRHDPRSAGQVAPMPRLATRPPVAPQPVRGPAGLVGRVSRRELARNPYMWFAVGIVFSLFAALATGCALVFEDTPPWAWAIPVAGAVMGALVVFTREGPAMTSWANHALIASFYVASAVFIAAFPDAAGAGLGIAIFIGPIAAVRLIDRRQIIGHLVAATIAFTALVPAGLTDVATSLSIGIMLLAIWGLGGACVAVLEAAELQGDELEQLVRRDPLTGLGNRRMLTERLTAELVRHSRTRRPFTILALDLNGFKPLNDRFGHAAGDQLLVDVAGAIEQVARDEDTVVRQGGDEFCLLLPETAGDGAVAIADAIRASLAEIEAHGLTITTGIGIASYPTEGTTPEQLLSVADELLRSSKETARAVARRESAEPQRATDPT